MNNKVLIILPTYNRSNYLEKIIDNIQKQTHENWNLIIIDDGSDDKHLIEYNKIMNKNKYDDKIIFCKNSQNKGIGYSLNKGISYFLKYCAHDYITWISDDNIYTNNFLKELVDGCNGYDFVHSDYAIVNTNLKKYNAIKIYKTNYKNCNDLLYNWNGCGAFMWSRNLISKIKYYKMNLYGAEDYEYLLKTFFHTNKINYIDKCLMKFILHSDNLSFKNMKKIKKSTDFIKKKYFEKIKNKNYSDDNISNANKNDDISNYIQKDIQKDNTITKNAFSNKFEYWI